MQLILCIEVLEKLNHSGSQEMLCYKLYRFITVMRLLTCSIAGTPFWILLSVCIGCCVRYVLFNKCVLKLCIQVPLTEERGSRFFRNIGVSL